MIEEPKLKKKKHFSKKYLFFSIITLFMFGGISYGLIFFYQEYQGSSMGMTTDILTVNITEDGYVAIDNATGQKDIDAINNNDYTEFYIENNSLIPVRVRISLVEDSTSTMNSNQVRFGVKKEIWDNEFLNIANLGENNNVLCDVYLDRGVNITLNATIWLDYYYTGSGEKFSGKYKVEVMNSDDYANTYLTKLVKNNKGLYAVNRDGLLDDGTSSIFRYHYSGKNPDNYINYNNELWRILSIDKDGLIKIVRDEALEPVEFGSDNQYTQSNTIFNYLNEYYENGIDKKYKVMIEVVKEYRYSEPVNLDETYVDFYESWQNGLIGSIDAIDYLYSTDPVYYTSALNDTNVGNNTWLTGNYLTTTAIENTTTNVLAIKNNTPTSVLTTDATYPIKPAVFLNRDISIISGNGTKEKPYEIEINKAKIGDKSLVTPN